MGWFNYYGLAIMILLMIPNVLMSIRHKEAFENHFDCKPLEIAEQIGRYLSFILMVFNIPFTYAGWMFDAAELIYIIVNGVLILAYAFIWFLMRGKNNLLRAVLLSAIPSAIFIFSGLMILSVPLIISSLLFAVCHITVSVKNVLHS